MACTLYGPKLKAVMGTDARNDMSGLRTMSLRSGQTGFQQRNEFDALKDYWLGVSGSRVLKFWDGTQWQTITST